MPDRVAITRGTFPHATSATRPVFDPTAGRMLPTAIVDRDALRPGARLSGPAVVVERETSTIVTSPFDVVMQHDGSLLLVRKEAAQ